MARRQEPERRGTHCIVAVKSVNSGAQQSMQRFVWHIDDAADTYCNNYPNGQQCIDVAFTCVVAAAEHQCTCSTLATLGSFPA